MCGIVGFNWEDQKLIKKMTHIIKHRGPDDFGYCVDRYASFGQRRLSILDLSVKGRQPMEYEHNGRKIIIDFNGEIYNFLGIRDELKKKGYSFRSDTDTEVILAAYLEYGFDCVKRFNGMWAFCIYDVDKKIFFLSRDRLGKKPLYYYFDNNKFIFASEIKSILEDSEVKRSVNIQSLNTFISFRYIHGENTIFNNVWRVLAGHSLIFDLKTKKIEKHKYWDIEFEEASGNEEYFRKHILLILKDAVKKRLISDVPLGAYLSGGIDSSAVVAMMAQLRKEEQNDKGLNTFSVSFEHGEHVNESEYAQRVSDIFETNHKNFFIRSDIIKELPNIIWHFDEPLADPAAIPIYFLSENAKKHVTVILTGDGGDEVFAGYDQYKFLSLGNRLKCLPLSHKISKIMKISPNFLLNKIYKHSSSMGKSSFERIDRMICALKKGNTAKAYCELISIFSDEERKNLLGSDFIENDYESMNSRFFDTNKQFLNKLLCFDLKNLLPECFLMKTDKMTMAYAIEGRAPLLDYELVEFSCKIPARLKINGSATKYILKKALHNILPRDTLYRKKQTFHVPIENWIEKDLISTFESMLDENEMKRIGFNPNYIKNTFENYKKTRLVYARQLWSILNFYLWHRIYIDGENVSI